MHWKLTRSRYEVPCIVMSKKGVEGSNRDKGMLPLRHPWNLMENHQFIIRRGGPLFQLKFQFHFEHRMRRGMSDGRTGLTSN